MEAINCAVCRANSIFVVAISVLARTREVIRSMKKLLIGILLLILIGTVVVKICNYFSMTSAERFFYSELKKRIRKGEREIKIKNLTNFEWGKVWFIGSYSGFKDKTGQVCGGGDYDGAWALAFTQLDFIVRCIKGKDITFNRSLETNTWYSPDGIISIDQHGNSFIIKEDK